MIIVRTVNLQYTSVNHMSYMGGVLYLEKNTGSGSKEKRPESIFCSNLKPRPNAIKSTHESSG